MLYSLSCKYLQDRELAEDVVQQVYLRLWESRSSVCITASLKNYLYTMAKNHVLNMIRDKNEWIVRQYENIQQENDIADDGLQEKLEEERKLSCFYRAVYYRVGRIYDGFQTDSFHPFSVAASYGIGLLTPIHGSSGLSGCCLSFDSLRFLLGDYVSHWQYGDCGWRRSFRNSY